jgi:single-stranded DNA-binding protein
MHGYECGETPQDSPACSLITRRASNRLGESIAETLHKGDHVLVDGMLVSKKYENENGKSKKSKAAKVTVFWSVRANSVRRLSRAEAEVPTHAASAESGAESSEAPF